MATTRLDAGDGIETTCGECGAPTTLSAFALWAGKHAQAVCRRKGWGPITHREVALCDDCRQRWYESRREESRREFERERTEHATKRAAAAADAERAFFDQLK